MLDISSTYYILGILVRSLNQTIVTGGDKHGHPLNFRGGAQNFQVRGVLPQ